MKVLEHVRVVNVVRGSNVLASILHGIGDANHLADIAALEAVALVHSTTISSSENRDRDAVRRIERACQADCQRRAPHSQLARRTD